MICSLLSVTSAGIFLLTWDLFLNITILMVLFFSLSLSSYCNLRNDQSSLLPWTLKGTEGHRVIQPEAGCKVEPSNLD